MLMRWLQGRALFTERDWLLLFGTPARVFTLCLWLRLAVLLVAVVAIGYALGLYVLPHGLGRFVSALILAGVGALLLAPKWLG